MMPRLRHIYGYTDLLVGSGAWRIERAAPSEGLTHKGWG